MREGGKKKHLKKKNIEPVFRKVNESDKIKKSIGPVSRKVNEGDEMFFLIPKITCFFFGNRQQSNARAGQKKHMFFWGNVLSKSNARAHLKQRKKHSGLYCRTICLF